MSVLNDAAQLARDLDRSVTGEEVLERLLTGLILVQRENSQLKAQLDQVLDKMLVLSNLLDSDHAAILVLQGQQHQRGGGIIQ